MWKVCSARELSSERGANGRGVDWLGIAGGIYCLQTLREVLWRSSRSRQVVGRCVDVDCRESREVRSLQLRGEGDVSGVLKFLTQLEARSIDVVRVKMDKKLSVGGG